GRTAHLLGQLVVAAPAPNRVLRRVEGLAHELERGGRVVVEAAYEPRVDLELDAQRTQALLHALEMRSRLVAEVVAQLGGALDDREPVVALGVEHPQWARLDALAEVVAQAAGVVEQVLAEHGHVAG